MITAPTIEWLLLSPLLVLLGGAAVGVLVEAVVPRRNRYVVQVFLAMLSIVAALALTITNWISAEPTVAAMGSITIDNPAYFFWTLLLIFGMGGVALFAERAVGNGQSAFASSAATVPGSPLEREADRLRREHTEIFPLLLFALFGMLMFASANDLLTLFVALEILSLPLYLLCGMARRRRLLSQEAALKYFMLGALSSGFLLYGIAMLYGYSGGFHLYEIADAITAGTGSTTVLKRRLSAADSSFTPLSRLLAVAITLKPRVACTSEPSSGMGSIFSDSTVISESCTSAGMRVSSSTRAILPLRMACISGLGTSAFSEGPWASSWA